MNEQMEEMEQSVRKVEGGEWSFVHYFPATFDDLYTFCTSEIYFYDWKR